MRVLLGLLVLLLPASAGAQEIPIGQPLTLPVPKGTSFVIHGVIGQIEVTRAAGDDAVMTVTPMAGKYKPKVPAAAPRVEMVKDAQRITICGVHVSPNPKKPNECQPGGGNRLLEGIRKDRPGSAFRWRFRTASPSTVGCGGGTSR